MEGDYGHRVNKRDDRAVSGYTKRTMSVQNNHLPRYRHNGIPRYPTYVGSRSTKDWVSGDRNGCNDIAEGARQRENRRPVDHVQHDRRLNGERSYSSQSCKIAEQERERIMDSIRVNRRAASLSEQPNIGAQYSEVRTPPDRMSSWNSQGSVRRCVGSPSSYSLYHGTDSVHGYGPYGDRYRRECRFHDAQYSPKIAGNPVYDNFNRQQGVVGSHNWLSRQSTCSCLHCQHQPHLPSKPRPAASYFSGNSGSRHFDRASSCASDSFDGGSVCGSLYSHDPLAQKRAVYFNGRAEHLCRPIKKAAPFIICISCNELLQLPMEISDTVNKHTMIRCGSCSELTNLKQSTKLKDLPIPSSSNWKKTVSTSYKKIDSLPQLDAEPCLVTLEAACPGKSLIAVETEYVNIVSPTQSHESSGKEYVESTSSRVDIDVLSATSNFIREVDDGHEDFSRDAQVTRHSDISSLDDARVDDELSILSGVKEKNKEFQFGAQITPSYESDMSDVNKLGHSFASSGMSRETDSRDGDKDDNHVEAVLSDAKEIRNSWSSESTAFRENDFSNQDESRSNSTDGKINADDEKFDHSWVDQSQTPVDTDQSVGRSNSAVSRGSSDAGRDEDLSLGAKNSDSFLGGLMKKGLKFNQPTDKCKVTVNGHPISDRAVKRAEKKAGPIDAGSYWYDYQAGFWGVMGHECIGIIPPFIKEFHYPLARNCSGGDTGVLVNGRELHSRDLVLLVGRGLPPASGKSYTVDMSGKIVDEASGKKLRSLGKLAPTVEKLKRGFGMHTPDQFK